MIDDQILLETLQKIEKGVCLLDKDLNILFWNDWFAQKTGIERNQIIGQPFISLIKDQAKTYVEQRLEEVKRTGHSEYFSQSFNQYLIEIPVTNSHLYQLMQQKVIVKPLIKNKATEFLVIYLDDVTLESERIYNLNSYRKNLEGLVNERTKELQDAKQDLEIKVWERTQELEKAKETAEKANQSKSDFLAGVSHELRTPMNAILGFSEILSELVIEPEQKKYLSTILSSGKTLLAVIDDILDISKVEANKIDIEYSAVNLTNIVKETTSLFTQTLENKGIPLIISIPENLPDTLLLDEVRIRQVLINLIGNAIKFTEAGHVKVKVDFTYPDENQHSLDLQIDIEDTGVGIPGDQHDLVFEAFQQMKGQDRYKYGGSGLGLAITKKLLEMMNGQIKVSDNARKGSIFSVILRAVQVGQKNHLSSKAEHTLKPPLTLPSATILVVDDVKSNRELILGYLNRFDVDLLEASSGKEAFELAVKYQPDLVLMDIRMPKMDGYEATRLFKGTDELAHIPIIAITAGIHGDKKIKDAGFSAALHKPVNKQGLLSLLEDQLKAQGHEKSLPTKSLTVNGSEKVDLPGVHEEKADLPSLLKKLETARGTSWLEIQETLTINDIEDFARKMKRFGDQYRYPQLQDWSNRLLSQALLFDISGIPATLAGFDLIINELVEKLESQTQKA